MSPWVAIPLVLVLLAGSMAALSAATRRGRAPAEAMRKLLHVEMGLLTLGFPWLFAAAWPVALLGGACVAWFGLLHVSRSLQEGFALVLQRTGRDCRGAVWFVCGVGLTFLFSAGERVLYCIAILVLALADAAAAVIGRSFGRPRRILGGARKSAAGSLAFFIVAFAVAFAGLYLAGDVRFADALRAAFLVATVTAVLEALLGQGLDNLFVPLGALAALKAAIEP